MSKQMKLHLTILVLGFIATGAMAQSQSSNEQSRMPVVGPFQALGNVIRNPDADRPKRNTRHHAPVTPTAIPPGTLNNPQANPQSTDSLSR
jgi:Flp pilus assembly secretin CpaC